MARPCKYLFNLLFAGATLILVNASANSAPFPPGCKQGDYNQPKQACDLSAAKAKLNGIPGEIWTYKFKSGFVVKRFIAADFSFEMAKHPKYLDWSSAKWYVSNPRTNECSLNYKDPITEEVYPILTTWCGD